MNSKNKSLVSDFIDEIWNKSRFEKMDDYLSPNFTDHSLPVPLPPDKQGMMAWITGTSKAFEHFTFIDDAVSEENKVMLKIRMQLKHIGIWRDIQPTYMQISTVGYRYYRLEEGKIVEHWSLIDGNSIENQLRDTTHGCKIQQ